VRELAAWIIDAGQASMTSVVTACNGISPSRGSSSEPTIER
jgi:hypothetical protein